MSHNTNIKLQDVYDNGNLQNLEEGIFVIGKLCFLVVLRLNLQLLNQIVINEVILIVMVNGNNNLLILKWNIQLSLSRVLPISFLGYPF